MNVFQEKRNRAEFSCRDSFNPHRSFKTTTCYLYKWRPQMPSPASQLTGLGAEQKGILLWRFCVITVSLSTQAGLPRYRRRVELQLVRADLQPLRVSCMLQPRVARANPELHAATPSCTLQPRVARALLGCKLHPELQPYLGQLQVVRYLLCAPSLGCARFRSVGVACQRFRC